jgi:uncharacterized membrane protein YozB (DUF420 family)
MNGDLIQNLPLEKTEYSENQMKIANIVFKENKSALSVLGCELKEGVILSILFIIFSSPQLDAFIIKTIPNSNNMFVMYSIKCILIIILFYIFKNFHLSRK